MLWALVCGGTQCNCKIHPSTENRGEKEAPRAHSTAGTIPVTPQSWRMLRELLTPREWHQHLLGTPKSTLHLPNPCAAKRAPGDELGGWPSSHSELTLQCQGLLSSLHTQIPRKKNEIKNLAKPRVRDLCEPGDSRITPSTRRSGNSPRVVPIPPSSREPHHGKPEKSASSKGLPLPHPILLP